MPVSALSCHDMYTVILSGPGLFLKKIMHEDGLTSLVEQREAHCKACSSIKLHHLFQTCSISHTRSEWPQLALSSFFSYLSFSLSFLFYLLANPPCACGVSTGSSSSIRINNDYSNHNGNHVQAHRSYCIVTGLHDYLQGHRDYTSCGSTRGMQSSGYISVSKALLALNSKR